MKRIGKIEPNAHRQICGGCNIEMYRSKKDQRVMCCDFCGITVPANDVKPALASMDKVKEAVGIGLALFGDALTGWPNFPQASA